MGSGRPATDHFGADSEGGRSPTTRDAARDAIAALGRNIQAIRANPLAFSERYRWSRYNVPPIWCASSPDYAADTLRRLRQLGVGERTFLGLAAWWRQIGVSDATAALDVLRGLSARFRQPLPRRPFDYFEEPVQVHALGQAGVDGALMFDILHPQPERHEIATPRSRSPGAPLVGEPAAAGDVIVGEAPAPSTGLQLSPLGGRLLAACDEALGRLPQEGLTAERLDTIATAVVWLSCESGPRAALRSLLARRGKGRAALARLARQWRQAGV